MEELKVISDLSNRYKVNGSFVFDGMKSLRQCIVENGVPESLGVYLIFELGDSTEDLVYVGKAGSVRNDGSRSRQGLATRLRNKQDGLSRQSYFSNYISKTNSKLRIYWFETLNDDCLGDIPSFVEAMLLQDIFKQKGTLPNLNKSI